jgi:hypothetical protein
MGPILLKKSLEGLVSFNPRVDDGSIRMNSIAYEYAYSITGEIFIAEGAFQQKRPKGDIQVTPSLTGILI